MAFSVPYLGHGVGLRTQHFPRLWEGTARADWFEAISENFMLRGGRPLAALEKEKRLLYNIGNGQGFSVMEVIESVRRVTGHPIPIVSQPRRDGDPPVLVAEAQRIRTLLGWSPRFDDLDAIIDSSLRWERKLQRAPW